jgi:hypothetical protein
MAAQPSGGPRKIFLGWTALVFIAGGSYYFAKVNNTKKKRLYREKQLETGRKPTLQVTE